MRLCLLVVFLAFPCLGQEVQRSEPKIGVDIAPTKVLVGRKVIVTFQVEVGEGVKVYFPESPDTRPFRLLGHEKEVPSIVGTEAVEVHRLILLPLRVGTAVLAPIEVPYVSRDGQALSTRTPEVRIEVLGTLGDEANPEVASAGEPVPVYVTNTVLVWTLSGLGIAIAAGALGALGYRAYRRWKEAHRPPPPPRPPLEVALERLGALDAVGLIEAGEMQQLALQVSEIFRDFLGSVFGFPGVDMTTFEVVRALSSKSLGRVTLPELEDFLEFCDLVKFAKWQPSKDEALGLVSRARSIVERIGQREIVQGVVP